MTEAANAEQAEFWNTRPGQIWVERQGDMDLLLGNVGDLVLSGGAPVRGEVAMDVGCGAGATSFALAEAVGPEGRVLGVDISVPLVARAEARRRESELANTAFLVADAQVHGFEPAAFDLIASRFGVMFFAGPEAAFANMGRALRPGGRLTFAAWAGPEVNPWFAVPQRIAVARLGPVPPVPPEAPGPMAFRDIDRVCGILAGAGFSDCRGEYVVTDLHHPGGVAALVDLATEVGPVSRLIREKDGTADDLAAIRAGLGEAFADLATADGARVPAGINLFSARWG